MAEPGSLPKLLAIVGTTGSGKSDLAIQLARALGGEIISADSRQVYRGLDLGSAKVTPAERALAPHHLLDVADVRQRFTVAAYQQAAFEVIDAILARGRVPILVGGTGLYVRAVIDNPRFPVGGEDTSLRAELEQTPLDHLVARLRSLDPLAAERIDLKNARRVVRALEVTLLSGQPYSAQRTLAPPRYQALQLGLAFPADELRTRIDARIDARLADRPSMLDEVRGLLADGVPAERLLELGLEYRYLTRYLLREVAYEPMVRELKTASYQFSRRQLTWFRRDPRIHWLADPHAPLPEAERRARAFLACA